MTRKQKNLLFWTLVLSLNFIPLVAQGDGPCPPNTSCSADNKPAKNPHWAGHPHHSNKTKDGKTAPAKTAAADASAKTDAVSQADAPTPPQTPDVNAPADGTERDLTMSDLTGANAVVMDFDAQIEGANPSNSAKLKGRIFKDCAGDLAITSEPQAPGCGKNAAFRIHDNGKFASCMKSHKTDGRYNACADGSADACVFLSDLTAPNSDSAHPAVFDLSKLGSVSIQLVHRNPNGNEDHQNVCQDFTTRISHTDQATMDALSAAADAQAKQQEVESANAQVRSCRHSWDELQEVAYPACDTLVILGQYDSKQDCVASQHLDQAGIKALSYSALHESPSDLDEVTNHLISWANSHPKECKKAIEPLHQIAKRLAKQPTPRATEDDEEVSATDGYDAAINALQSAKDEASCLTENDKLSEMIENLKINRTERLGEAKGMYSPEFQTQYAQMMQDAVTNVSDNCSSWEMNPACQAATHDLQTASTVQKAVQTASARKAQAQAALCQMVSRASNGMAVPPQCQQSMMPGMSSIYGMPTNYAMPPQQGIGTMPMQGVATNMQFAPPNNMIGMPYNNGMNGLNGMSSAFPSANLGYGGAQQSVYGFGSI